MQLNHINLVLNDVSAGVRFFEQCFGFLCTRTLGDNAIAVMEGGSDFTLVLMKSKEGEPAYPAAFHIGFMQKDRAEVDAAYEKIRKAGYDLGDVPRTIRQSYGFYFNFETLMIEVGTYHIN